MGSIAEQEAASETEPTGVDPWAEAFAESSRVAALPGPVRPPYPVTVNPQVQHFLDRFTGERRDVVTLWVGRAGRYLGMIRDVLRRRGMPEELAYTAMIESGYNPRAVSRVGAKGMWQFMASTARRYGLRVDQWIDERLDPEKSTVAAAAYLRDLYAMFGSWSLAQAAYNAGEVKVSRAIRATGSSDFWTLAESTHLRRETKDFVPQIHAATLIGQDPERYGFEFTQPEPLAVDTLVVPASTDLRRLAARSGVSLETMRALNPVLVRPVTPPGGTWALVIPVGSRPSVQAALAPPAAPARRTAVAHAPAHPAAAHAPAHPAAAAPDTVHVVKARDTVSSIAKRYGITVADVLRWNRLQEQARIRPGDRLRVADVRPSVEHDGQGGFR
ncbi:MAG TPA: transglycosylase SLT domain-containing protein [Candidatus Binatia bacterium]|nr:transglycosylase SLT domain-containing protein [Candidatus Binatia bacterium]